ncbi:hypothetical protein BKA70DRAFT_1099525, partial [Coprinopsis sp. MPI-PUGE-AT-0042]
WRLIPSSIKQAMRENLPLRDLYRLKDHGKLTEEDIVDIVEARFGERLKPFGLNGEFVLRLIEKTDAVISGSFVLAVLFPSLFSPKDIDFFISPGRHQLLMKALRTCGYTDSMDDDYVDEDSDTDREEEEGDNEEEGTEDEDEDEDCDEDSESEEGEDKEGESEEDEDEEGESEEDEAEESDHEDDEGDNWEERAKGEGKKATYHCLRGIRRMFEVTNPTTGKTINIIESSLETPLAPLPFFHSSLVMNYIAFHGLVVLHPRTTVEGIGHKNRCLTSSSSIKTEEAWEKYTDRGFHLVDNAKELEIFDRHVCKKSFACPSTRRHLEDEGVLHIPFRAFEDKDEAELAELRFSEEGKEGLFEWGLACQGECGGDSSYESMPYISFKRGDSYIFGRMET